MHKSVMLHHNPQASLRLLRLTFASHVTLRSSIPTPENCSPSMTRGQGRPPPDDPRKDPRKSHEGLHTDELANQQSSEAKQDPRRAGTNSSSARSSSSDAKSSSNSAEDKLHSARTETADSSTARMIALDHSCTSKSSAQRSSQTRKRLRRGTEGWMRKDTGEATFRARSNSTAANSKGTRLRVPKTARSKRRKLPNQSKGRAPKPNVMT